ncbi:MAG: signal recognition particle-docking protein FtsY [Candidatus Aenigmarchaeota archaeon]|nr:signal recognition particle-docking protein FtsY [Candidatus Aenigmarchaeota archaeon]
MFGILRKKLSKAIESISEKFKKKEEVSKKVETKKEEIEKIIEKIEEKKPEEIVEEIKPIQEIPEAKKEVEKIIEEAKPEIERAKLKERKGLLKKITEKIVKKIKEKKLSEEEIEPILKELETGLIESDVAFVVAEKIKNDLKNSLVGKEIKRGREREAAIEALRQSLLDILSVPKIDLEEIIKKKKSENRPAVFIFFGINGVGKSLNLSKVAKLLKDKGYRPIMAAGDTFRAAGSTQLEEYGEMIKVPVISHQKGGDSCAVIFDAIKAAEARGYDVVLADSSGRMHTKKDLLDELAKIVRVNKPDLKILVLDSLSGGDVLLQYEFFNKAIGTDAVLFAKVDINEKGGNILSICYSFKVPIIFLGTGQKPEDLVEYDPKKFVEKLIGS